jgi:hypothetical protein
MLVTEAASPPKLETTPYNFVNLLFFFQFWHLWHSLHEINPFGHFTLRQFNGLRNFWIQTASDSFICSHCGPFVLIGILIAFNQWGLRLVP